MNGEELYAIWAPESGCWSPWVKPVVFAAVGVPTSNATPSAPDADLPTLADFSLLELTPPAAIIVDLPGPRSLQVGLLLAELGYRPIPLYNACAGPSAVVPMEPILQELPAATARLANLALADDAPPAFLLDSRRRVEVAPVRAGAFDNRWLVFPQDFPSGGLLASRNIRRAILIQPRAGQPQDDLAHVLLRWQEEGIDLQAIDDPPSGQPQPLTVRKPSWFRAMWHRAFASLSLTRNSAGGFGSVIPESSSGG